MNVAFNHTFITCTKEPQASNYHHHTCWIRKYGSAESVFGSSKKAYCPTSNMQHSILFRPYDGKLLANFSVNLTEIKCETESKDLNYGHYINIGIIGLPKILSNKWYDIETKIFLQYKDILSLNWLINNIDCQNAFEKETGIDIKKNMQFYFLYSYYKPYRRGNPALKQRSIMNYNRNHKILFDSYKDIYDKEYSLKENDTITINFNQTTNIITFIKYTKDNSKYIWDKSIEKIDTENYDYAYVLSSFGCDCEDKGFYSFDISYALLDWETERIIWIGFEKNGNNNKCQLATVSKDVIKHILKFLR